MKIKGAMGDGALREAAEGNELKKAGEDGKVSPASDGRKEYPKKTF